MQPQQNHEVAVYGGTGGVMTAIAGACQGLKKVLLEARSQVGRHWIIRRYKNPLAWFYGQGQALVPPAGKLIQATPKRAATGDDRGKGDPFEEVGNTGMQAQNLLRT